MNFKTFTHSRFVRVGMEICQLWRILTQQASVKINDPAIIYHYSRPKRFKSQCQDQDLEMIWSARCCVTLVNRSRKARLVTRLTLTAVTSDERYPMQLFHNQNENCLSANIIPPDGEKRMVWETPLAGYGFTNMGTSGLMRWTEIVPIRFLLSYRDERGKCHYYLIGATDRKITITPQAFPN